MPSEAAPDPIEVPYGELSAELLNAVIESFVLREGNGLRRKRILARGQSWRASEAS